MKSKSITEDDSLYEEYGAVDQNPKGDDPKEDEGLYEEYMFEGDYEEYRFRYQEYGQKRKSVNARNARSIDETFCQKLLKKKWWFVAWFIGLIPVLAIVVVLSIYLDFRKGPKTSTRLSLFPKPFSRIIKIFNFMSGFTPNHVIT